MNANFDCLTAPRDEMRWRRILRFAVFALILSLLAGCAGESETTLADVEPSARESATTTTEPPPTTTTVEAPTTTVAPTTTTMPPPTTVAPVAVVSPATMPLIPCGTDLQTAQDLVQDAGVFFSTSIDATGENRFQMVDRNWTVVLAEPAPGTPIADYDPTFYVLKDSEFPGC